MRTWIRALAAAGFLILLAACGDGATPPAAPSAASRAPARAAATTAAAYNTVLQQIYMGYFGRPADPAGQAYFAKLYLAAGAPTTVQGMSEAYFSNPGVRALIDSFGTSQESRDLYPGNNQQFITAVYHNLFNRDPDTAGQAYWAGLIDSGTVTRANAALSIMAGSRGSDIIIVANKTDVAVNFTAALQSPGQQLAYDGLSANAFVRGVIASVGLNTDPKAFQASVSATIDALVTGVPAPTNNPMVWEQASSAWNGADWQ